jgi:hypothetical protein
MMERYIFSLLRKGLTALFKLQATLSNMAHYVQLLISLKDKKVIAQRQ